MYQAALISFLTGFGLLDADKRCSLFIERERERESIGREAGVRGGEKKGKRPRGILATNGNERKHTGVRCAVAPASYPAIWTLEKCLCNSNNKLKK